MHGLGQIDVRAYAKALGREKEEQTVRREIRAAEVASSVDHMVNDLQPHHRHLSEINAVAARWLWPALVSAMLDKGGPWWSCQSGQFGHTALRSRYRRVPAVPAASTSEAEQPYSHP